MRVVVLGAAGNFGARIVRALLRDPNIQLVAAGRQLRTIPGAESIESAVLNISDPDLSRRLRELSPGLVIHCVGPFQGQDYRVAQAALLAGAHYLDLADGRDFVAGFEDQIRDQAIRAHRIAISGASTLPALSSAVVEELRAGIETIESIDLVIAPGQRAVRGVATLAAVFSYLGKPFPVWREGRWARVWGWMDLPPNRPPSRATARSTGVEGQLSAVHFGQLGVRFWPVSDPRFNRPSDGRLVTHRSQWRTTASGFQIVAPKPLLPA